MTKLKAMTLLRQTFCLCIVLSSIALPGSAIPTQATGPQLTTLSVAGTCHFEDAELCNYQYDNTSDVGWKWSGSEKPYMGYVFNNSNGQFIYTVLGPSFPDYIGSRIISPLYDSAKGTPQCLEFHYYMEGDDVGELNVYIVPYEELTNRDRKMMHWSQVFDGGPGWKRALISLTHPARYYVVFESVRGNADSYHGLDDVTIYNRECLSTDMCDFESFICLWSNTGAEINTGLNWIRYQGMQMTVKMAPAVDHTVGTPDGSYMMVESTLENKGKKAWLYSQVFPSTPQSPFCFSFWYYMYGNNVGKLRVYIQNSIYSTSIYSDADLWELHGPIDDEWHLALVNISSVYTQKPFMIILEAEVGDNAGGVFAVDDTEFQSADCSTEPPAARVTADNLVSPDCNFNNGSMCAWTSVGREDFNNFTIDAYTATGMEEEQSNRGDFLVADSELQSPIKTFGALSPLLPSTDGTSCFSFWYRMYKDVNSSLEIDMVSVGTSIPIWKAFPDNSDDWMPASVNIHSDWDYKLLIKARTGDIDSGSVMVDDVKLVHGPCPRSEVFDFENGLMGFTPSGDPDISWEVTSGHSSFVPADHTYQTSYGHVLQANLGTPNKLVIADMKTPLFPPTGDYECMEFWYMKNGTNSSWLSVLLTTNNPQNVQQDTEEQWTTTATTSHWGKAYVEIFNFDSYWIQFQAGTYGSSVDESAAIDDIRILPTNCPADADCDFEYDNCGYESSKDGSAKWESVKGLYGVTTMETDHSTKTVRGSYMEVIIPDNADRMYNVNLTSRHVKMTFQIEFCVSFWYYGLGDGVFQVSAKYGPQNVTTVFTKNISNEENVDRNLREWKNLHVGLNKNQASSPFQIVFTFSSQAAKASLALDDIVSYEMPCSDVTDRTEDQNNGEVNPGPYFVAMCDFEHQDLCTYKNANTANVSWTMFSIDTKRESNTGIDYDHTKSNRYGHYIYLDTTGLPPNTTAQLISNPIPSASPGSRVLYVCLDFSYIMNGKDVNRLNVYTVLGDTRKLYWTISGDQGKDWHQKYVEIKGYTQDWQVMFEAVAGGGDLGDIGLDDVNILAGGCPGEASCTFEIDSRMCDMDQDNLDEADWDYWSGASENNTDPQVDHTYETDEGHYIRMHMNTTQIGDKARIFTKMYDDESAKCLEFWYHIKNPANNTHVLSTILRDERGVERTIGTYRGFFDEVWNQARYPITLSNLNKFQIGFQGQSGGPEGSIAIDDIMVSGDECDSFITCGFEASTIGPCGWEPVTNYSFPEWEVLPSNRYVTVNFSDALQVTKLASESVYVGEFCLSMQYMIYGDNAGYFNISLEVEYPKYETKTIFNTYGSQGKDKWSNAFIYEPTIDFGEGTETVKFVITGTSTESFDSMKEGVIKVTDIFFSTDYTACMEHKPDSLPPQYTCKNGGGTFPDSIVCNFIQNCKEGDDEKNCGSCDFQVNACNWIDESNGPYSFEAIDAMNTSPGQTDANNHTGKYLAVVDFFYDHEHDDREHTDFADIVLSQELGPSPSGCMMTFRYYMPVLDREDSGNIYVVLEENFEETELWHSPAPDTFAWQRAYVDIGGIHARFKLHIRASQLPFDNAMGIDDITFPGCSFPEPVKGPCPQDQFKCHNTEACIDNDKLCDFTDECGDGSDEDPVICAGYIMDNFEDSLGYWSEEIGNTIKWRMHAGSWISTTSGPRRDHTLGTHFGHFIVMDPRGYAENSTAGLISPMFAPTQDDQCKIRFHYHMYGASDGLLTLFMKSNATDSTTVINEYRTTLNDSWLLSEQVLTSPDSPFQVLLKGRVVGYYTSEIGLDDISFTPACQLIGSTTTKPDTGGGGSDSWKIPVGVVLGLVGLIAVIAGTLFYLKSRRGLKGFSFSLFKSSSGAEGGRQAEESSE